MRWFLCFFSVYLSTDHCCLQTLCSGAPSSADASNTPWLWLSLFTQCLKFKLPMIEHEFSYEIHISYFSSEKNRCHSLRVAMAPFMENGLTLSQCSPIFLSLLLMNTEAEFHLPFIILCETWSFIDTIFLGPGGILLYKSFWQRLISCRWDMLGILNVPSSSRLCSLRHSCGCIVNW